MSTPPIRPRERDAIVQSLRAGVVPRTGQQHIQVGRVEEVKALIADLDRIADGGSGIRFVIGEFGSGKTFFLYLIRSIALEKRLVTVHCDLTPDRRLHATGGQARALYQELVRNMSTRAKPEGGALASVVERFVTAAIDVSRERGVKPEVVIRERLAALSEMVNGYDFAEVIAAYWKGHDTGNETLKSDAVRWLRGEFSTRTDARAALGVRTIVDDANVYDQLKLLARFVRLAGYAGTIVCCDELVNLYKLANTKARNSNYEQILRILNDCLQGSAEGLGFLMGGTPEFLLDTRKGLYSYQALQSRLAENRFVKDGLVDYSGPVLDWPISRRRISSCCSENCATSTRLVWRSLSDSRRGPAGIHAPLFAEDRRCVLPYPTKHGHGIRQPPRRPRAEPGGVVAAAPGHVQVAPDTNPDLQPLDDEGDAAAAERNARAGEDDLASFKL